MIKLMKFFFYMIACDSLTSRKLATTSFNLVLTYFFNQIDWGLFLCFLIVMTKKYDLTINPTINKVKVRQSPHTFRKKELDVENKWAMKVSIEKQRRDPTPKHRNHCEIVCCVMCLPHRDHWERRKYKTQSGSIWCRNHKKG